MAHRLWDSRALISALVLAAPLAHAQGTYQFDFPEQPLADSLRAIATKTGTNILFDPKDVRGSKAAALSAMLTVDDALDRVLAGTQLEAERTTASTVIIRPSSGKAASADIPLLEEIVVSARRKDEQLTTVPASITAYSSDFLQKQNIRSFVDYATRIPNLTFQYGQGADLLWSGGRETTVRGVAGSGTTAYYINDTPVPSSVSPQTLNLERIEVLKGPQGTLFGASSMGGNVRFITQQPSLQDLTGTLQVQAGRTRDGGADFDGNAQGNFVLVPDRIALDAAFGYSRESGFIMRRFPDASGAPIERGEQGRVDNFTGSLTIRARLSDSLEATIMGMAQTLDLDGFPAAHVPLPGYKPVSYTVDRDRDVQEYSKDRWSIGSVALNYSGVGFSVVSSTSFFARRIEEKEDDTEGDNLFLETDVGVDLGDPALFTVSDARQKRFTQEIRLAFDEGTLLPRVSGIVGAFYQHTSGNAVAPGIHVQEMEDAGLEPAYLSNSSLHSSEDNAALFGEVYYEILPKLTATVGLRHYWIEQTADPSTDTGFVYGPEGSFNPGRRNSQSGLVPKAVLSYEVGDSGNIYASVAKGFRVGGSQSRLPDICSADLANLGVDADEYLEYESDTLWSYEIGAKSRLADGSLSASAAAFQIDWSDIQQTAWLPTCALSFVANAGKARIRGGEVELTGRPVADVPLSVQVGVGYTEGVLLDPGLLAQAPNSPLGQVPEWTGTISGYYETPIDEGISVFVAADYSYTDSVAVPDGSGGFLERQPFNLVNGNIGISFGRSQLLIYGKNLLDKRLNFGDQPSSGFERQIALDDGTYQRLPRAVVSRPRQLGVQYQVSF